MPTIVSRDGTVIVRQLSPVQRRITPSCPPANTDVGLAAHTASSETSVSPCRSTAHAVAGFFATDTVTLDVDVLSPADPVMMVAPVAVAVTTPDADTVAAAGFELSHWGVSPSMGVPSFFRATS